MYFNIHIQPIGGGSSDCIVVDNFHPNWRDAARKLKEGAIVELMQEKTNQISKWSGIPLVTDFNDYALNHISLPIRGGLDLWDGSVPRAAKYRSHNIHTSQEVGAVAAIITEYINWLNFALKDLERI